VTTEGMHQHVGRHPHREAACSEKHAIKRHNICGIQIARLPSRMGDGTIELAPLRISDWPLIGGMLRDEQLAELLGLPVRGRSTSLLVWLLIRKNYCFAYAIRSSRASGEPLGFIGLHSLTFGVSARIGLVIPCESYRRLGYGRRAVTLLVRNLESQAFVERVVAEIRKENRGALLFARKMGFSEEETTGESVLLSLPLERGG
jgi:RimJ/RimL family protein N-acetyltransferase